MNGTAWFFVIWFCVWPVIAITFATLYFIKVRHPKKRLAWVENEDDDE